MKCFLLLHVQLRAKAKRAAGHKVQQKQQAKI